MQAVFDDALALLEWPDLLAVLCENCLTGYGRLRLSDASIFLPDQSSVESELLCVDESKRLIQRYGLPSLSEPPDILPLLKLLAKQGVLPSVQALADLRVSLDTLRQLARFFIQYRSVEETPTLLPFLELVTLPNTVLAQLEALVMPTGELKDEASPTYATLKQQLTDVQAKIRQTLTSMITRPQTAKYLQEPIMTEREGRAVLPVKAEHKVDVPGLVHDTSSSGSTLYIEPKAVIELNNKRVSIQAEMEREIQRILQAVSSSLWPEAESLLLFLENVTQLDAWVAKARLSLLLDANPPQVVSPHQAFTLRRAKHPLLMIQLPSVVPNDISVSAQTHTMLITGPNTGGKTVLLKLLGLYALMLKAGLHLPVSEQSSMPFYEHVCVDLGDPQNMAQNLSTFSGHIRRLKSFLEISDLTHSFILIDEICAGTDPQEGAALAKALLQTLSERGATTVVTTHMGELKVFAHESPGFLNASVAFDIETLKPTYHLQLGVSGQSHALEIAHYLGIAEGVTHLANRFLQTKQTDSAELIASLEQKQYQLNEELRQAKALKDEIAWEEQQLRQTLDRITGEKKQALERYRQNLRDKLIRVEEGVEGLKQKLADRRRKHPKEVTKMVSKVSQLQDEASGQLQSEAEDLLPKTTVAWEALLVGDTVTCRSMSLPAVILDKHPSRRELTLQAGILKTTVPLSDIIAKITPGAVNKKNRKDAAQRRSSASSSQGAIRPSVLRLECDVRGLNGEDAIGIIEKQLDDAMMTGYQRLDIIHGLGTGALKQAIRAHLRTLPFIKSFEAAAAIEGGDGKTIVLL